MLQLRITRSILSGLFFASIAFTSPVFAVVTFSIGIPNVEIGSDMDGASSVGGGGSAEILPQQENARGLKIGIGSYVDGVAFEGAIVKTDHDGQWLGIPTTSEYQSINLDYKVEVFGEDKFHGVLLLGVGFTSVKVINGSTNGIDVQDAKFKGLDFRVGLGLNYRLTDNLLLEINAVKRNGSYNTVDGIVSGSISDDVSGDGVTTLIELKYLFDD